MTEIMLIEGRELGNGKTLAMVIMMWKLSKLGLKILSNIRMKGIEYEHIDHESQMFTAHDSVIVLDEADKYVGIDVVLDGKIFYESLIRHARKNNLDVYFITQRAGMIQARVRLMCTTIALPNISRLFKKKQHYKWNEQPIYSRVHPKSILTFPVFQYREDAVSKGRYEDLPFLYSNHYKRLPYYFQFYNTNELAPDIAQESYLKRRRIIDSNEEPINEDKFED